MLGVTAVVGPAEADADGDPAGVDGVFDPDDAEGDCPPPEHPTTMEAATRIAARVWSFFTLTRFRFDLKQETPPGTTGRRRVGGPASFAGTNQIRFRGSVVLPHSQRCCARRRRIFSCRSNLAPTGARRRRRR